jgi:hypothetical protein
MSKNGEGEQHLGGGCRVLRQIASRRSFRAPFDCAQASAKLTLGLGSPPRLAPCSLGRDDREETVAKIDSVYQWGGRWGRLRSPVFRAGKTTSGEDACLAQLFHLVAGIAEQRLHHFLGVGAANRGGGAHLTWSAGHFPRDAGVLALTDFRMVRFD